MIVGGVEYLLVGVQDTGREHQEDQDTDVEKRTGGFDTCNHVFTLKRADPVLSQPYIYNMYRGILFLVVD